MKFIIKIILNILLIIALFFNAATKLYNNYLIVGLLITYLIINYFLDGYRKPNKRDYGMVCLIIFLGCFFTLSLFYMIGIFSEFNRNFMYIPYHYLKSSIWITVMIIIALTEVIRYITMNAPLGGKKTSKILLATLYIIFILIDINVAQKNVNIEYFNSMYEFFALTFCTSVTKNLFLMWISRKNGILPCLIYKAIFELYVFVIPYVPNINMLIQSVMFMLLPFVLYIIIDGLRSEREVPKAKEVVKRKLEFVESVILLVFFAILAGLVSREFKYSMIAVGSGSMTGTLNKGDAIIYKRYNGEILHEGDVIVFKIDGRLIVHRINKRLFYGDEYAFITKGDANDAEDNWIVESNMVVGRVVQRVQYIAWPSVWISEYY